MSSLEVGSVVADRYRVVRTIGEGGMGRVLEAEQRMGSATRKVALKVVRPELLNRPEVRERFLRECSLASQLSHPSTIRIYDFGEAGDGAVYLAMELARGRTLAKLIEEDGPLAVPRSLHIVEQIVGSLTEAHELGIVHRDLKPENVMVHALASGHEIIKVLDFGIATYAKGRELGGGKKLTLEGTFVGSAEYAAPEQITGVGVDARTDVYALALVTYEMLAGRRPFAADSTMEWIAAHLTEPPTPLESIVPHLPTNVVRVIGRALSKDPNERPPTAQAFFQEMAATRVVADTVPVQLHTQLIPPSPLPAPPPPPPMRTSPLSPQPQPVPASPTRPLSPLPPLPITPLETDRPVQVPYARTVPRSRSQLGVAAIAAFVVGGVALASAVTVGIVKKDRPRPAARSEVPVSVAKPATAETPPTPTALPIETTSEIATSTVATAPTSASVYSGKKIPLPFPLQSSPSARHSASASASAPASASASASASAGPEDHPGEPQSPTSSSPSATGPQGPTTSPSTLPSQAPSAPATPPAEKPRTPACRRVMMTDDCNVARRWMAQCERDDPDRRPAAAHLRKVCRREGGAAENVPTGTLIRRRRP